MAHDRHELTAKYLWINYGLALLLYAILLGGGIYDGLIAGKDGLYYAVVLTICGLLFPFACFGVEKIALNFTSKKFWTTGFFIDTPGKNGLWTLFYLFCFTFAIPLGGIYFLFQGVKKCGLNRPQTSK
ncbi:colicin E1 family microcin immunity protein [Enterobacillus tribolii]|uniref:Colicin E1 (Microcin) immunity protein n=1 Tax=Enterobacillus tribolii TaxID=1487935 RepID=A0A370R1W4_9GAMM|nr:colicin E1 family microcin immunity protein [Enterobacillus tribolii]MBW7982893.1 hypothetical protein [Enterobacillus tribolii]RDK95546.1 colicin E1 (microcin) immunity protein [Enterobacillus tribolii]